MRAAPYLVLVLTGCAIETEVGRDVPDRERVANVPSAFKHELDLLFVVDDDQDLRTIHDEAAMLWRRIRGNLAYAEGGFPSVHIGVITSDVGVGAVEVAGCTARGADAALLPGPDGSRWLEVTGEDAEWSEYALAARLQVTDGGCPYDQPLAAIERALDGEQPLNDGFLREGASLGIVIVSGGDDCSVEDAGFWDAGKGVPVDTFKCFREGVHCAGDDVYVGVQNECIARQSPPHLVEARAIGDFLRWLRPDANGVVVTGAIGDRDHVEIVEAGGDLALAPSCEDPGRPLKPGVRLGNFVRDMGGTVAGVCKAPVDAAGPATGLQLRDSLGHRCLKGRVMDVEPDLPGLQTDCLVVAREADGREHELEACPNPNDVINATGPCWAIKDGAGQCGDFPTGLSLQVNWGGDQPMTQPAGVTALVSCVVEMEPTE